MFGWTRKEEAKTATLASAPEVRAVTVAEPVPEIKMEDIKRTPVRNDIAPEICALQDRARKVLGYICGPEDYRLRAVMEELGISQLDFEQVHRYMESKTTETMKFVRYPIAEYRLPIPAHVLETALQIKERLPDAEFTIYNYERAGSRDGAGDPFLWVSVAGWGRFIEVWEEATFEGRKVVEPKKE